MNSIENRITTIGYALKKDFISIVPDAFQIWKKTSENCAFYQKKNIEKDKKNVYLNILSFLEENHIS